MADVEYDIAGLAHSAICKCERGFERNNIAADIDFFRRRDGGKADRGYTQTGKTYEFAGVGYTIAVEIAPDAQIREHGVKAVDYTVRIEIMGCKLDEPALSFIAKELGSVIDYSVAIGVEHEEAIVWTYPSGFLSKAVAIKLEINTAVSLGSELVTVTIEVEHYWVPSGEAYAKACLEREVDELGKLVL
jgi:hypothetical protein